jgi:predicted transcriptional regulator YdeE
MVTPELVTYPGFSAYGISARTTMESELEPVRARSPAVWSRFYDEALPARLSANAANGRVVGVFSSYENGARGNFTMTAGVQMLREQPRPAGLDEVRVSPGEYLRFTGYGSGPPAVATLWRTINEFFAVLEHPLTAGFERAFTADFERYGEPDAVHVFVAVKRKLGVHPSMTRLA